MIFCPHCKTPRNNDDQRCPHCERKTNIRPATGAAIALLGLGLAGCDGVTLPGKEVNAVYGVPITYTDTGDTGDTEDTTDDVTTDE